MLGVSGYKSVENRPHIFRKVECFYYFVWFSFQRFARKQNRQSVVRPLQEPEKTEDTVSGLVCHTNRSVAKRANNVGQNIGQWKTI